MKATEFEERLRRMEYFHQQRVLDDTFVVLRVDGRSFSRFTRERFEKPFDERFRDLMVAAAAALLEEFQALYAYTESDEISVLLPRSSDLFDRSVEKLVSLSAATATSAFVSRYLLQGLRDGLVSGSPPAGEKKEPAPPRITFDSRIVMLPDARWVEDYFRWRMADAGRCALNGWAYWTLRKEGLPARKAASLIERRGKGEELDPDQLEAADAAAWKNELLFQRGINFAELPAWQRRGVGLYWETYEKAGFNPKTQEPTITTRRRIRTELELPWKEEYGTFLRGLMDRPSGTG